MTDVSTGSVRYHNTAMAAKSRWNGQYANLCRLTVAATRTMSDDLYLVVSASIFDVRYRISTPM